MSDWIEVPVRARSAAQCAQMAASRRGVDLRQDVAEEVARAVLEYADDEYRVRLDVAPEYYPSREDDALRRLRRQLAVELADKGWLPVTLPRKVINRPGRPWEPIGVELVVSVRRPLDG